MKQFRAASQILFGFLPEQTVDLEGRVWKVREWQEPLTVSVDDSMVRRELLKALAPWALNGMDGGFAEDLLKKRPVSVVALNRDNGVRVEPFPRVWMCRSCRRVPKAEEASCRCGARTFGQLPFVGVHDKCGAVREPWIPRCKAHDDVKVVLPGTTSAAEIVFQCPECSAVLRKGFGLPSCECGEGRMTFNVHRAASVFTPRTVVVVNPPSPEKIRRLNAAGGPSRALEWIVTGLSEGGPEQVGLTRDSLLQQLLAGGVPVGVAEEMVRTAESGGALRGGAVDGDLSTDQREAAEQDAVTIAMALSESRARIDQMAERAAPGSERSELYGRRYVNALRRAGLEGVELVDKFPILTGCFGYSRGAGEPGETRVVPFKNRRGEYLVYADAGETEALFVRLDPVRVARWLERRGHALGTWSDARTARLSIMNAAVVPGRAGDVLSNAAGGDLLRLVHSYAHRFMRNAATLAGIERNALSELIVAIHGGFFVYAGAKGDFVLGGLQALFETELDRLLLEIRDGERRCALDPGCQTGGGACMACLHVGEPSCRYFNGYLDRGVLFGDNGYFRMP